MCVEGPEMTPSQVTLTHNGVLDLLFISNFPLGNAGGCISMGNFDANDPFDYSGALGRTLDSGVPVTLYYGKTDTACNYVGGYAMANTISWEGMKEFAAADMGPMVCEKWT